MGQSMFRKESMEHISSPEQLNDYLRVTTPMVWVILIAVIILLAGMLFWGSVTSLDSYATGTAQVKDGLLVLYFDDQSLAESVKPGMQLMVGDNVLTVSGLGTTESGSPFATAETTLADGSYPAKIIYKQTQLIRLLFR